MSCSNFMDGKYRKWDYEDHYYWSRYDSIDLGVSIEVRNRMGLQSSAIFACQVLGFGRGGRWQVKNVLGLIYFKKLNIIKQQATSLKV